MKFFKRVFFGIQKDFLLFFFVLILLEIYRAAFMLIMSSYLDENINSAQILTALFAGLRLSLKTAGVVAGISFVLVTIFDLNQKLRLLVGVLASLIFSTLFMMRFSYFREFDSTFGLGLLQGLNGDFLSLVGKVLLDYGFIWRFPVALLLTLICIAALSRLLLLKTLPLPKIRTSFEKIFFVSGLILTVIIFSVFVRFGGSFSRAGGLSLSNAAVTTDDFLNENILDDGQALYRTFLIAKLMKAGEISGVDEKKILDSAEFIAGGRIFDAENLADYLFRITDGARITKPQHIFVILGESWSQWELLGRYENLKLAEGLKSIIAEENSYYSRNFLPNSDSTAASVAGILTGLPDLNTRVNYQPQSYEETYITSPAQYFRQLGYKVDFWYGGAPNWENLSKLAIAQGFDNFYGYPDLHAPKQTNHGTKDEFLFDALKKHLEAEPPTVHFILTTTNQPPYNLDLKREGFDAEKILAKVKVLSNVPDAESLTVALGHYWYMDKVVTAFVRDVEKIYPESLFVLTGSRTARNLPNTHPTIFESQSVPFVIHGAGVTKKILPADAVGSHISIAPTIIELVAQYGFEYYSIAPSLFARAGVAFDKDAFLTENTAGRIDSDEVEFLPHVASSELNKVNLTEEVSKAEEFVGAERTVAWWILNKGLDFEVKNNWR